MKKIIFAFLVAMAICAGASAQQTIGGTLDFTDPSAVGIGARYTYAWDNIRLAPDVKLFFPDHGTEFDLDVNVHYMFNLAPKFNLYPLAGLWVGHYSINETIHGVKVKSSNTDFGLNLGVGADYEITQTLSGFAEFKGVVGDGSHTQFALGVAYKF